MSEDLLDRRRRALGPAYRLFYDEPLHLVRGEGVWVYDAEGRRYLDAYNNVVSVGHCHPRVVEAIYQQAATLNTHTRYLAEGVVDYAEALLAHFPPGLGVGDAHLMMTCTGSEANDLALRIARAVTGGEGLIVTANAYHGVTESIAEASPSLGPENPIGRRVWVVPAPVSAAGGADVGGAFTAGVEAALADMKAKGMRPAAVMVDTIFSSDGIYPDPPGFLAGAAAAIRAAGGLFIADEVQAGFARTGPAFWGFARHGLTPDIVTLGKPMGNGHPVAGVVVRADLAQAFGSKVRYFNTFGGNPVSAAAALATLRVIEDEGLAENAAVMGARLAASLAALPGVKEVRHAGLFFGVELDQPAGPVVGACKDAGVLLSATGANILKVRPPLILRAEEADQIAEGVAEGLKAAAA